MGHYPFTLFNGITALVLALTLMLVWRRFRGSLAANWPLVCYALIAGYTIGFSGGAGHGRRFERHHQRQQHLGGQRKISPSRLGQKSALGTLLSRRDRGLC